MTDTPTAAAMPALPDLICGCTDDRMSVEIHRCDAPRQLRGDLWLVLCKWCGRAAPFVSTRFHGDPVTPDAIAAWSALSDARLQALAGEAALMEREAAQGEVLRAWVGEMKTSAGTDFYVCVGRDTGNALDDSYLTPTMTRIRGRAEYHVAEWNHLLGHGPKPDILAFDTEPPTLAPPVSAAPAGEGWATADEIAALVKSRLFRQFMLQGFWHAAQVDLVWRYNGEDVREEADWLKDLWYRLRDLPAAPSAATGQPEGQENGNA